MRTTSLRWFSVPLIIGAAVGAAIMFTHVLNRRALHLRLRSKALTDAEAFVRAIERLGTAKGGCCSHPSAPLQENWVIYLNTSHRYIKLPRAHLCVNTVRLLAAFDCYALLQHCGAAPASLQADVWNGLCAMLEARLTTYLQTSTFCNDVADAATALAIYETLQLRDYSVAQSLSTAALEVLTVRKPRLSLLSAARCKSKRESGLVRSTTLLLRLLHPMCRCAEKGLLIFLAVANACYFLWVVRHASPAAAPSALLYSLGLLEDVFAMRGTGWNTGPLFVRRVLCASPGRLLAEATLGTTVSYILTSAKEAISDIVLRQFHATIITDTVLALTRFDYVADVTWPLPGHLYGALNTVTGFSLADVDSALSLLTGYVRRCYTVWRLPMTCGVGWLTQQGLDWLHRLWTRTMLMASFIESCDGGDAPFLGSLASSEAPEVHRSELAYGAHYGLEVLVLAVVSSPPAAMPSHVMVLLGTHTHWPLTPLPCLHITEFLLRILSVRGTEAAFSCQWAAACELLGARGCAPVSAPLPFPVSLRLRRSTGDLDPPSSSPSPMLVPTFPMSIDGDMIDDVMGKALSSLKGAPLMAALAILPVEDQGSTAARGDAAALTYDVTRVIEAGALFPTPPVHPWARVSAYCFDVQTAKLRYHEHHTYATSVADLLHARYNHQPHIDGRLWASFRLPPSLLGARGTSSCAWRITFDHVSFRYPGTDHDVLHDVTFDIPAGGFLGIVGYSGAGKSTLLLLLSRLYAPSKGRIWIDGFPIELIPPRALRRRIGNCWQSDASSRFLDGVSVESNVAYGHLAVASASTVTAALADAHIHEAVQSRPSGMKTCMRVHEWSGGEVERLAIARTLILAPSVAGVYVFDECTSALDSVTERGILGRAQRTGCSSTRIVVSHRLSSVRKADEIIVLANGRIVERGTWDHLLHDATENFIFQGLYRAQAVA